MGMTTASVLRSVCVAITFLCIMTAMPTNPTMSDQSCPDYLPPAPLPSPAEWTLTIENKIDSNVTHVGAVHGRGSRTPTNFRLNLLSSLGAPGNQSRLSG